jgi:hypothetical protein
MTTDAKQRSRTAKRASGLSPGAIGAIGAMVVFVVGVAGILLFFQGGSTGSGPQGEGVPAATSELARTGEVNAMGLPVVETPGYTSGVAQVAGVTVQGANWAMGQVPLDVAVRPFWTLTNTGTSAVTLGDPKAEVREGCCPGAFDMGSSALAPGESTMLTFELSMHEGMDGWHDMGVYVPVEGSDGQQFLELNVTGDFRN